MKPRSLYSITFPNGKRYVGIAFEPGRRWAEHKRQARIGTEHPLYRAIRKYGNAAVHQVLVIGEDAYVRDLEIKMIEAWKTDRHASGYNISKGGDLGSTGLTASSKTREKMSKAAKGRKQSSDWIANRSRARIENGKGVSESGRANMSAGQKLRDRSSPKDRAHMKRMAAIAATNRKSPEYREKARQAALRRWAREKTQEHL